LIAGPSADGSGEQNAYGVQLAERSEHNSTHINEFALYSGKKQDA
jgi:hypothetical protein